MKYRNFGVVVVLLTLTMSALCLLAPDAECSDSTQSIKQKTPDGKYEYTVEPVNNGGQVYSVTDMETKNKFKYEVKYQNNRSIKSVERTDKTDESISALILHASHSKMYLMKNATGIPATIYIIGGNLTVTTNATNVIVGNAEKVFKDCKQNTELVFTGTSNELPTVTCYLNKENKITLKTAVNLNVMSCDTNLILGDKSSNLVPNTIILYIADGSEIEVYQEMYPTLIKYRNLFDIIPINAERGSFIQVSNSIYYVDDPNKKQITANTNATTIGDYAFYGCKSLESVTIPNSVTTIGKCAFGQKKCDVKELSGLESITFESGDNSLSLESEAIFQFTKLESIQLPYRTTIVGVSVFNHCTQITTLTFEESQNYLLESFNYDLSNMKNLKEVMIPVPKDNVLPTFPSNEGISIRLVGGNVIEDSGLLYHKGNDGTISLVNVPAGISGSLSLIEGLTSIPDNRFSDTDIVSITIPSSVKTIGEFAFSNSSLEKVTFSPGSQLKEIGKSAFAGTAVENIEFPDALETIMENAFRECLRLESIEFKGDKLEIGSEAFRYCKNLTDVDIVASSLSIGDGAFRNTALQEIDLPEGTTEIGHYAFANTKLTSITIPSTVTKIWFDQKTEEDSGYTYEIFPKTLAEIVVAEGNSNYFAEGNVIYEIQNENNTQVYKLAFVGYCVEVLQIKPGTMWMYDGVLKNHSSLVSIEFPQGFKSKMDNNTPCLPTNAFKGCSSIITIDASKAAFETVLEGSAFIDCPSLRTVMLPKTLTELPSFTKSKDLSKIVVHPDNTSLKSIEDVMVISKGNDTLIRVVPNIQKDSNGLRAITIPAEVRAIELSAFQNVTLDAVYVDNSNTCMGSVCEGAAIVGSGGNILYIASTVDRIHLPDSVTKIESNTLRYATNLYSLTWGDDNTSANLTVENQTSNLEEIVLKTTGTITLKQLMCENLSNISITCSTLTMSSVVTSQADYHIAVNVKKLSGSGSFGGGVTSISVDDNFTDIGQLLSDGNYDDIVISKGEQIQNTVKALTDKDLTVKYDDNEIPIEIESIIKKNGKYTITFTFDYNGFTVHDVDATVGTDQLPMEGGGFNVTIGDSDVTVTLAQKSDTGNKYKVTFDPTGGTLPRGTPPGESDTLEVGENRTIDSMLGSMEPSRKGYVFKGWYTDRNLAVQYKTVPIIENMTLYARWSPVNGHLVGIDDPYGRVTATYEDGRTFYSGDRVLDGTVIALDFKTGNGIELLGWTIDIDGHTKSDAPGPLKVVINDDTKVIPNLRVFSESNSLINTTDLPTPEWENVTIVWQNQYDVDTSMTVWTGMPSIPVIVDDSVYVRAADTLYKLSIHTGKEIRSVTEKNTTSNAYYHYLGYGGGVLIDYNTRSAYDLDLNRIYGLSKDFTAVFYDDGYFYGLYDKRLWKFDAETGSLETNDGWSQGVGVSWHGIYGTTSTPIFDNGRVYFIEVNGDERMIGAVDLETGARERIVLDQMNGYLCDDGWLTMYEYNGVEHLFVTGYTGGLFDSPDNSKMHSIIMSVALNKDGSFDEDSVRWMRLRASAAASALVVVDGRGYINVTQQSGEEKEVSIDKPPAGVFYVIDIDKFLDTPQEVWADPDGKVKFVDISYQEESVGNLGKYGDWVIYVEESISSHGSIVVSTAYKDEGDVYIYLLPYTASEQALYTFHDREGKTATEGIAYLKSSPVGMNYGSQAIRVGQDGELIWYTDSGTIWCVMGVSGRPFQFLVQDVDGAEWLEASGTSMADALNTALKGKYGDKAVSYKDGIVTVNGVSPSIYFEDGDIWTSIDIQNKEFNAYRTFFVSLTILTDEGKPLDLNKAYGKYYLKEDDNVKEYKLLNIMESPPTDGYFSKTGYVTVTVDAKEGKLAEGTGQKMVVSPGSKINVPAKPSRNGYEFVGWEIDGKIYTEGEVTIDRDTTILAKWEWENESEKVAGVTITSKYDGFVNEPWPGKWVDFRAAGYGETKNEAFDLMRAANGFNDMNDVADRTMFMYFGQRGTVNADSITGRLFLSDGTQIYQETLEENNTMWYLTLSSTPNSSGGTDLSKYYKLGETYTMAIYIGGKMACSADVTITDGDVSDVTCKGSSVTISDGKSILLTPTFYVQKDGAYVKGNVADEGVTWRSDDKGVATVDGDGNLKGISAGTATITVTTDDGGHVAYCYVTVKATPVDDVTLEGNVTVQTGDSRELTVEYRGVSATVSWSSNAPDVAVVDSKGKVTGVSAGTAVITVTVTDSLGNTKTANCVVTVKANLVTSITMKGSMTLKVGGSGILEPTVSPTDADNPGVVWTSSNSLVATVSNGIVTAIGAGTATITATAADGSGKSASCVVTVSKVVVESVTLSKSTLTLNVGGSSVLTATIEPSNAEDKNLVWTSSNSLVATVQNGAVTAVGPGTATIMVSTADGSETATCTVTVKGEVTGITLDRTSVSMTKGDTDNLKYVLQPEGTGGYTVSWTSSDTGVVTVSNGKITAIGPGTATITATVGGTQFSAVCAVTVVGSSTEVDKTTEKNEDGSVTTAVTEKIDAGSGTSVNKVTETTTKENETTSSVITYTLETKGSKVTTTITMTSDADGDRLTAETFVPSTVSNGIRTVSPADMRVALEQMSLADIVSGEDVSSTATVNVSTGADVLEVQATIPSDLATGLTDRNMRLVTDVGMLDMSGDVFDTIKGIGGDAVVNIGKVTGSGIPSVLDGKQGVSVFEVSLNVGGKSVHQLGGTVTMGLPYTLGSGQSAEGVKVYYVDDSGNMTVCQSVYDAATGIVSVPTSHFSTFAIVYEATADGSDDDDTALLACIVAMGAVIAVLVVIIGIMFSRGYLKKP